MHLREDVAGLLKGCGLEKYVEAFVDTEVCDLETMAALTNEDIASIIGPNIEERNRLLCALGRDCEANPPSSFPQSPGRKHPGSSTPSCSSGGGVSSRNSTPSTAGSFQERDHEVKRKGTGTFTNPHHPPGMSRYLKLLRQKALLLKRNATQSQIQDVEREILQVMRQINLEGMPSVNPVRGDKVRIISYGNSDSNASFFAKFSGHLGVVVSDIPEDQVWSAVKVRLTQTGEVLIVPPHCLQHAAESRLAQRLNHFKNKTHDDAASPVHASSYSQNTAQSARVRRAVEKERLQREDPFTLHGFQTHPIFGRLSVELVLQPQVSAQQVLPVMTSPAWVRRGVLADTIHYNRAEHTVSCDVVSGKKIHPFLESELRPLYSSFSIKRKGGGGMEREYSDVKAQTQKTRKTSDAGTPSASTPAGGTPATAAKTPTATPASTHQTPPAKPDVADVKSAPTPQKGVGKPAPSSPEYACTSPNSTNDCELESPLPRSPDQFSGFDKATSPVISKQSPRPQPQQHHGYQPQHNQISPPSIPVDLASLRRGSNTAPSRCSSFRSTVPGSTCGSQRTAQTQQRMTGVQIEDELRIRLNESVTKCTRLKVYFFICFFDTKFLTERTESAPCKGEEDAAHLEPADKHCEYLQEGVRLAPQTQHRCVRGADEAA